MSQLKRVVGQGPIASSLPDQLTKDLELVVEPTALLDVRTSGVTGTIETQVLLQWANLPEYEATWEDYDHIQDRFPDFHLEDKLSL